MVAPHPPSRALLFRALPCAALWSLSLVLLTCAGAASGRCLDDSHGAAASDGVESDPIVLEVNLWPSHALATNVLAIILREALVSQNGRAHAVELREHSDVTGTFQRLATSQTDFNAEVWPRGKDHLFREYVEDEAGGVSAAGASGYVASEGWYVPQYVADDAPGVIFDHWLSLRDNPAVLGAFPADGVRETMSTDGMYLCGEANGCVRGKFYSPSCEFDPATNLSTNCRVLYDEHPLFTQFRDEQVIANLGLNFSITYVDGGRGMKEVLDEAALTRTPVVFYSYEPHTITASSDFMRVAMPRSTPECESAYNQSLAGGAACEYPSTVLRKLMSASLKERHPPVAHVAGVFRLEDTDVAVMMRQFVEAGGEGVADPSEVACDWVKNNREQWEPWVRSAAQTPPVSSTRINWLVAGLSLAFAFILFSFSAWTWRHNVELRRSRADLVDAKRAADAANLGKSAFLSQMSHELRTPLNGTLASAELLAGTDLSTEQREYVSTISASGGHLLCVINDILEYTKYVEHERLELDPRMFDVCELAESAVDLSYSLGASTLEVATFVRQGVPPVVFADDNRLRQVLCNLLSNAFKFCPRGQVVLEVSVAGQQQPPQQQQQSPEESTAGARSTDTTFVPSTTRSGAGNSSSGCNNNNSTVMLQFSVRDWGIGIPPDRQDRLFKAFSQADQSTTRHFGGTGLGLAISKKLIESAGGTMWCSSTGVPGEGATFFCTALCGLPPPRPGGAAAPLHAWDAAAAAPLPPPRSMRWCRGARALVLERNAYVRKALVEALGRWGFASVLQCVRAAEAVEAVAHGSESFDLMLIGSPARDEEDKYDSDDDEDDDCGSGGGTASETDGTSGSSSPCRGRLSDAERAGEVARAVADVWRSPAYDGGTFPLVAVYRPEPGNASRDAPVFRASMHARLRKPFKLTRLASLLGTIGEKREEGANQWAALFDENGGGAGAGGAGAGTAAGDHGGGYLSIVSPVDTKVRHLAETIDAVHGPSSRAFNAAAAATAAAAAAASQTEAGGTSGGMARRDILVAEDNKINQRVIVRVLSKLGFPRERVKLADNGQLALDALAACATPARPGDSFGVVFMDMQMPVLDGIDASRRIRELYPDAGSRPRVVGLTANVMESDVQKCLAVMDEYMRKPISLEQVGAALTRSGLEPDEQPQPSVSNVPASAGRLQKLM